MRTRRFAAIATGILLLVALLGFAPLGTAHADQTSQLWYGTNAVCPVASLDDGSACLGHLHNSAAPSKCLDVPGSNFYSVTLGFLDLVNWLDPSGTTVQLWDCEPQDAQHGYDSNQIWYQQNNGDGTWTFKVANGNGRFCLDAQNLTGYGVGVNPCNGQPYQKWTLDPNGQQFQSVGARGYCLDLDPATFQGDGNGTQVVLEPCAYLGSALYPSY